jgi:uncharacterized protein (DUF433 family)
MQGLDRITQSHDVMGGRACIRGMRVTVLLAAVPRLQAAGTAQDGSVLP